MGMGRSRAAAVLEKMAAVGPTLSALYGQQTPKPPSAMATAQRAMAPAQASARGRGMTFSKKDVASAQRGGLRNEAKVKGLISAFSSAAKRRQAKGSPKKETAAAPKAGRVAAHGPSAIAPGTPRVGFGGRGRTFGGISMRSGATSRPGLLNRLAARTSKSKGPKPFSKPIPYQGTALRMQPRAPAVDKSNPRSWPLATPAGAKNKAPAVAKNKAPASSKVMKLPGATTKVQAPGRKPIGSYSALARQLNLTRGKGQRYTGVGLQKRFGNKMIHKTTRFGDIEGVRKQLASGGALTASGLGKAPRSQNAVATKTTLKGMGRGQRHPLSPTAVARR